MKERNNLVFSILSVIVGIGVYNLCVFALFDKYENGFWLAYAFTMMSFLIQIVFLIVSVFGADIKKDDFWKLPFLIVDSIYLLVQLVVGIVLMILSVSVKITLVIEILIFGGFTLVLLAVLMGKRKISDSDRIKEDASLFIKKLCQEAESIYNNETDQLKKSELKKLYEVIRYSEPLSKNAEIHNLNGQIKNCFELVCKNLNEKSMDELSEDVRKTIDLLAKRNLICKTSK